MSENRHTIVFGTVTMTTGDTEYSLLVPKDARELAMKLADATKAWRISATTGEVAGGSGYPLAAGESASFVEGLATQTLYFACGSASQVLHYSYLIPYRTRP